MSAKPLPICAVLGAGTMGTQIALSLAVGGASVRLWGRRAESLGPALEKARDGYRFLADNGLADPAAEAVVLARISTHDVMAQAVDGAGFIIEAISEDMALKQTLLGDAEKIADHDAVLSSTTSALSAGELQSVLARPQNFCIAHYAQPAHLVKLVEVVPSGATAERAMQATINILEATGKTAVRCPDIPGFLWARIQHAVLREFSTLVSKGLVSAEACDTILKQGYAARLPAMGSFEHADLAGLDLMNSPAAKAVWADLSNVTDPADTLVGTLYAQGHTGMRSGRGFYDWSERDPDAFKRGRDQEIVRRVKIQAGGRVELD